MRELIDDQREREFAQRESSSEIEVEFAED